MRKIRPVNYDLAESKAYEALEYYSNGKLPIDLFEMINNIEGLGIRSYSRLAEVSGFSFADIIREYDSKDGALVEDGDRAVIVYNDKITNIGRIRFTIAHEIGHFLIGHNRETDKTRIARNQLSEQEFDTYEKEANYFAKRLLVPVPVVYTYANHWNRINVDHIMATFGVSYEVSSYIIEELNNNSQRGVAGISYAPIDDKFDAYIERDLTEVTCRSCGHSTAEPGEFCSVCGHGQYLLDDIPTYIENKKMRRHYMKYPEIPLDAQACALKCPICNNEELEDGQTICQICGYYIQNICMGHKHEHENFNFTPSVPDMVQACGCSSLLSGNARFCPHCGGISTFHHQKILYAWDANFEDRSKFKLYQNLVKGEVTHGD